MKHVLKWAAISLLVVAGNAFADPLETDFTYQGELALNGVVVDDTCDFRFELFDAPAAGNQVGSTVFADAVNVRNGGFTAIIDFGNGTFDGDRRWLEIEVRCPAGVGMFTGLSPRQEIHATPHSQYSLTSPWSGLTGVPMGFADNTDNTDDTVTFDEISAIVGTGPSTIAAGSHPHSGDDVTSGTVGETFLDSAIARDSEIWSTVLANDGSASTLNADLLDGNDSTFYAPSDSPTFSGTVSMPQSGEWNNFGNVGIRTSPDPDTALHVQAFSDDQLKLGNTNQPSHEWTMSVNAGADLSIENENNGFPFTLIFLRFSLQRVGIGTTSPLYKLDIAGDIRVGQGTTLGCVVDGDATIIAGTCVSDYRLKQDIRPLEPVAQRLSGLQPVRYRWRENAVAGATDATHFGLIAQDVQEVMPELVTEDALGVLRVDYSAVPMILLQAIREHQRTIESLEQRIDAQANEIALLRQSVVDGGVE